jgi:hypothetical protein
MDPSKMEAVKGEQFLLAFVELLAVVFHADG